MLGQLLACPGQQAAGFDAVLPACVTTVEVDVVAGQDAAPAHLPAGQAFPQAIRALPTPSNNTRASDSAIEEENLFIIHSVN